MRTPFASDETARHVPFRVLVVPMEAGGAVKISTSKPNDEIRKSGNPPALNRNAHMKGATFSAFT
jgi:hypothetical protein